MNTTLSKTLKMACAAVLLPAHLAFADAALADMADTPDTFSMDSITCDSDGGMQSYVRDILSAEDTSGLDEEQLAMINGGRATDYSRDIIPIIYQMQRHASARAAEVVEMDSTGFAYPIVRDEMLCTISSMQGGTMDGIHQQDIHMRNHYRDALAAIIVSHSPDLATDMGILVDTLTYEEGRVQYGLLGMPQEIDHMAELMLAINNSIPSPLMVQYGHGIAPDESTLALGTYLLDQTAEPDSHYSTMGTYTLIGKIASWEHDLIPRLSTLALSDHPDHSDALEALRNTVIDNNLPEEALQTVYETLAEVLDNPDSSYRDIETATYGMQFIAQTDGPTAHSAQQTQQLAPDPM